MRAQRVEYWGENDGGWDRTVRATTKKKVGQKQNDKMIVERQLQIGEGKKLRVQV